MTFGKRIGFGAGLAVLAAVACGEAPKAGAPSGTAPTGSVTDGGPTEATDAGAGAEAALDAAGGASGDASGDAAAAATCTAAREQLLKPIDQVSTGDVVVLGEAGGVRTLYVDASAGGAQGSAQKPRVYLDLASAARVDLTDVGAAASTAWDLAIKRPVLFTNGGTGGPGQGASQFLPGKAFADVVAADVVAGDLVKERFLDEECNAFTDATGAVFTSFDGWYEYNQATNALRPAAGTWIVRGGKGALFKVEILSYYATPDGGAGQAGGRFTLKVAAL